MNTREHKTLLAEASELKRMLEQTPEEFAIDRMSLQSRLEEVQAELDHQPVAREPARSVLTFNGAPVVGSYGIFADFGAKAVDKFVDAVTGMAASLAGPLPAMGRIPERASNRVLITNVATGSFGFELEEDLSQREMVTEESSAVEQAFAGTRQLLESTLGTDDDLTEQLANVDDRVIGQMREYLQLLAKAKAVCAFEFRGETFRFRDVGQVQRSAGRLSAENVHEEEQMLEGQFEGAIPYRRGFEFKRADTGEVIYGKVEPAVDDVDRINDMRHETLTIRVRARWAGTGRPRYTLLELPNNGAPEA